MSSLAHIRADSDLKGAVIAVILSGKTRTQEKADKAVSLPARETAGATSIKSDIQIKKNDMRYWIKAAPNNLEASSA